MTREMKLNLLNEEKAYAIKRMNLAIEMNDLHNYRRYESLLAEVTAMIEAMEREVR